MSNFQQYTGDSRSYAQFPAKDASSGVSRPVVSGDIADFGSNAVPADGRWASHAGPATVVFDSSVNVPPVSQLAVAASVFNPGTGAPTSGSYVAGQECRDSTGAEFVCTVSGTPGTWVAAQSATFAAALPAVGSYTYDGSGNVLTDPEGHVYTYNADGTIHTETFNGVTRTYGWTAGVLTGVA